MYRLGTALLGGLMGLMLVTAAGQAEENWNAGVDCMTYIGNRNYFRRLLYAHQTLLVKLEGATRAEDEFDAAKWEARFPVLLPLDEQDRFATPVEGFPAWQDFAGGWALMVIPETRRYQLSYGPDAMQGWRGEFRICVGTPAAL